MFLHFFSAKSEAWRLRVMEGSLITRPSSSLLITTWQPSLLVSVRPNARSSMSFSSSEGSSCCHCQLILCFPPQLSGCRLDVLCLFNIPSYRTSLHLSLLRDMYCRRNSLRKHPPFPNHWLGQCPRDCLHLPPRMSSLFPPCQ